MGNQYLVLKRESKWSASLSLLLWSVWSLLEPLQFKSTWHKRRMLLGPGQTRPNLLDNTWTKATETCKKRWDQQLNRSQDTWIRWDKFKEATLTKPITLLKTLLDTPGNRHLVRWAAPRKIFNRRKQKKNATNKKMEQPHVTLSQSTTMNALDQDGSLNIFLRDHSSTAGAHNFQFRLRLAMPSVERQNSCTLQLTEMLVKLCTKNLFNIRTCILKFEYLHNKKMLCFWRMKHWKFGGIEFSNRSTGWGENISFNEHTSY